MTPRFRAASDGDMAELPITMGLIGSVVLNHVVICITSVLLSFSFSLLADSQPLTMMIQNPDFVDGERIYCLCITF